MKEQALRYNTGKPQMSMIPLDKLVSLARVFEYGAKKYNRGNYRKLAPATQHLDALMRHLTHLISYIDSPEKDPSKLYDCESWLPHCTHIIWNAIALTMSMEAFHDVPHDPKYNPNPPKPGEKPDLKAFLEHMKAIYPDYTGEMWPEKHIKECNNECNNCSKCEPPY